MDRRLQDRFSLNENSAHAKITYKDHVYPAEIVNYAFGGVLLRTDADIPKNSLIDVHFMAEGLQIEKDREKGIVIRRTSDGLALRFERKSNQDSSTDTDRVFG